MAVERDQSAVLIDRYYENRWAKLNYMQSLRPRLYTHYQRCIGKMMAKDIETGEIIGMTDMNHPNIISGKWRHHTYGTKCS